MRSQKLLGCPRHLSDRQDCPHSTDEAVDFCLIQRFSWVLPSQATIFRRPRHQAGAGPGGGRGKRGGRQRGAAWGW